MKRVRDIMTRDVHFVRSDASLRDAAMQMRDYSVGCLPVVENDEVVGLVTDRDIVLRAVADGRAPDNVTAGEVMTSRPITIRADRTVADAADLMRSRAIRRLVAIDDRARPVGIVTLGDLAAARDDGETKEVAEEVFHSPCCAAAH